MKNYSLMYGKGFSRAQRGVGMVEVLVSMLLLAIGVLGFSMLQVRAVEATGEALNRSQAILIVRGLAEQMRVNYKGQASYPAAVRSYTGFSAATTSSKSCFNATCTASDMAIFDAFQSAQAAFNLGVKLSMTQCPGATTRQCFFAAWGGTTLDNAAGATLGTASAADCMTDTGLYQPQATCVMMEAY